MSLIKNHRLTETQDKILLYLLTNTEKKITIRGLAAVLKKSYTLVYNNVSQLAKRNILSLESIPPASIISINKNIATEYLIRTELLLRNQFLNKNGWARLMTEDISKSQNPFFVLLLFGSYAKGSPTQNSDIDLLLITPRGSDQTCEIISLIKMTHTKTKKNIISVTAAEFEEMISSPNSFNVGNEARKHHLILYGSEQFYQLIRRVENE